MDIRRGIIRAFDSGTYLADVQIVGSMATMLTGVPVAKQIGADLITSGIKCGVLFFDETNPADACVVFIYGEAHPGHITIPQGKEFRPGGDADSALGEDGDSNLYLKDLIAGTKTLTQIGGRPSGCHGSSNPISNQTIYQGQAYTSGDLRDGTVVPSDAVGVWMMLYGIPSVYNGVLVIDSADDTPDYYSSRLQGVVAGHPHAGLVMTRLGTGANAGKVKIKAMIGNWSTVYAWPVGYWR